MKAQLPRITGFILALLAAQGLAADPVLPAVSDWAGTPVRWEVQGDQVLGRASGGECGFSTDVPAVVGAWEGDVLVGTVRVCQKGPTCSHRTVPLFAFFNPDDGSLTADVLLDPGCSAPLVREGRLLFTARAETAAGEATSSRRDRRRGKSHLELGNDSLRQMNGRQALAEFERALQSGEDRFTAYLGRGEAQMLLDHPQRAIRDYRRALALKPDGLAYYNLACVQSRLNAPRDAVLSLAHAVDYGFADRLKLLRDPDLAGVRELPAFQQVLAQLEAKAGR